MEGSQSSELFDLAFGGHAVEKREGKIEMIPGFVDDVTTKRAIR
jgi:hypothetical protein